MAEVLTPEQKQVVNFEGNRLLVIAGPGTGKTRTIVKRMIRLLSENPERLVSFLTFTRASRRDTYKTVKKAVGGKAVEATQFPRITTLHTFANSLVRHYAAELGLESDFSVVAEDKEKNVLFADVLEDVGLEIPPQELAQAVTCYRSKEQWPQENALSSTQRLEVLETFEKLLRFYNALDFEGTVWEARRVLSNSAMGVGPVLLQVDEYQDLNPVDQSLVHLVGSMEGSQVVVVGDDAQSIYGRRHAHFAGLRDLWNSPDWDKVGFRTCFRLPPHVLRAAYALIASRNYLGADVDLPEDDGTRLTTLQCSDENIQLRAVAARIKELIQTRKTSDGESLTYGNVMLLCPIPSKAKKAADTLLDIYGIPTRLHTSASIPPLVWNLVLVLRMMIQDSLALRQWLPHAGVEAGVITHVRREAMAASQSLYDYCSTDAHPLISSVLASLEEVRRYLVDDPGKFSEHLRGFPGLGGDEEVHSIIADIAAHVPAVGPMIRDIYQRFDVLDPDDPDEDEQAKAEVLVTTLHSAKGLEAEFVFVSWLNSKYFPSSSSNLLEAERLLYVALTRAKQDVFLTFHEEYDGKKRLYREAMSPLLQSISDHLDIAVVRSDDLK